MIFICLYIIYVMKKTTIISNNNLLLDSEIKNINIPLTYNDLFKNIAILGISYDSIKNIF